MDNIFLVSGLACLIAAVVGGGLKAFAIEVPVLASLGRQIALGVLGLILLAIGISRHSTSTNNQQHTGDGTPPPVTSSKEQQSTSNKPPVESRPTPDFSGGSKPFYSAAFLQWPTVTNQYGSVGAQNGEYVLSANSNTWVGPGHVMPITALTGDFIFEAHFRVEQRSPEASLQLQLLGSGQQADYISVYLEIWDAGNVTYSIDKGWIKDDHYLTRDRLIAERVHLEPTIAASDWSKPSKIGLKRENGVIQFFVNDVFVRDFPVSLFTVSNVAVEAAFKSKIVVTSLEGRVRP